MDEILEDIKNKVIETKVKFGQENIYTLTEKQLEYIIVRAMQLEDLEGENAELEGTILKERRKFQKKDFVIENKSLKNDNTNLHHELASMETDYYSLVRKLRRNEQGNLNHRKMILNTLQYINRPDVTEDAKSKALQELSDAMRLIE